MKIFRKIIMVSFFSICGLNAVNSFDNEIAVLNAKLLYKLDSLEEVLDRDIPRPDHFLFEGRNAFLAKTFHQQAVVIEELNKILLENIHVLECQDFLNVELKICLLQTLQFISGLKIEDFQAKTRLEKIISKIYVCQSDGSDDFCIDYRSCMKGGSFIEGGSFGDVPIAYKLADTTIKIFAIKANARIRYLDKLALISQKLFYLESQLIEFFSSKSVGIPVGYSLDVQDVSWFIEMFHEKIAKDTVPFSLFDWTKRASKVLMKAFGPTLKITAIGGIVLLGVYIAFSKIEAAVKGVGSEAARVVGSEAARVVGSDAIEKIEPLVQNLTQELNTAVTTITGAVDGLPEKIEGIVDKVNDTVVEGAIDKLGGELDKVVDNLGTQLNGTVDNAVKELNNGPAGDALKAFAINGGRVGIGFGGGKAPGEKGSWFGNWFGGDRNPEMERE